MRRDDPRILILGAGPTGLGAAWRLQELGHEDWLVVDQANSPGGLASSVIDEQGFTWDLGGHVLFSHYEYFDHLMDELLGDQWVEHERESWVWMRERFIPYPLQNNIWRLPPDDLIPCLEGLLQLNGHAAKRAPADFREWILQVFGVGLAEVFMFPYNKKVWAYEPERLGVQWMGERVATVDLARILRNLVLQRDETSWGPNALFRFPLRGGTGSIWQACAARLPAERIQLGRTAVAVSAGEQTVTFADGSAERFDVLLSSVPLDVLLRALTDRPALAHYADQMVFSSSNIVGLGMDGPTPEHLGTKCWMYFPEPEVPFYRVTVFSNYSQYNVPRPGEQWSLLCEVSESPDKPVDQATLMDEVIAGARHAKLLPDGVPLVSTWQRRLYHGYPTPFVGRDEILTAVDPALREAGIWSRGRFGAWKYEASNQDHSMMQGVEAVDHILFGAEETTYHFPGVVNARRSIGRRPAMQRE